MDSRNRFATLLLLCGLAAAAGAAAQDAAPRAAERPTEFRSQIIAPLSAAQAAELRAAAEAATFAAQAAPQARTPAAGAPAQAASFRLGSAGTGAGAPHLIAVSAIPEAPGWMVFLVCAAIALFVGRRAFGGPLV